jgi:hypothetical protein
MIAARGGDLRTCTKGFLTTTLSHKFSPVLGVWPSSVGSSTLSPAEFTNLSLK